MNARAIGIAICLLLSSTAAHAVFFFIPGSVTGAIADKITGADGEHCVSESARVGDVISLGNGYTGVVRSLSGTSSRCQGTYRIRARLDIRLPEHIRSADHTLCVPLGRSAGDKLQDMSLGEVQIVRVTASEDCSTDAKNPVQAVVRSTQQAPAVQPTAIPVDAATTQPAPIRTATEKAPLAVDKVPASTGTSPAAMKLRELNELLKDGVITQEDYNLKKAEILKGF